MRKQIKSAACTDIGPRKTVNQDSYFYSVLDSGTIDSGIFAVADGVSGSAHGERASQACAEELRRWWEETPKKLGYDKTRVIPSLTETILQLHDAVRVLSIPGGGRCATTLTVLLILNGEWFCFSTGDSRAYRLKREFFSGRLEQITEDQSTLVEKEYNGETYLKSVLTSCVGGAGAFKYSYQNGPISSGDRFLICSDGIYKTIAERQIKGILGQKGTAASICQELVQTALDNGETDNITAITVIC